MILDEVERAVADVPAAEGYLAVATERGARTYLLGPRTQVDARMLDWRTAPLAEAFFRHGPGERYELEVGAEGTVTARYLIVGRGRVDALIGDDRVITRDGETMVLRPSPPPGGSAERAAIVLDPEQQRAVDLPADTSLVLDGEAGVGKTLVALYRVAALQRRATSRFRALVLVPTEGLRRLVRVLADRLGIERLEIAIFEDWLIERAREAFPGLPKRVSETAIAQVIALKRHPAVRAVLADFIEWSAPKAIDEKVSRTRARLLHLFGDKDRLERVVAAAGGALPPRAVTQTTAHTRAQFETSTEKANRHVDADRLVALDGKRLDSGTPMEDANTFDAEDVPVLFELVRIGALPAVAQRTYDHIVVDEAQLRSPLELAAVGDALAEHAAITLAGDHRQATDETAWFTGWPALQAELGRPRWDITTLAITYRSVPAISELARSIVEGAPLLHDSAHVATTRAGSALAQAALLCWHLDALIARDPWRQIAVLARTPEHARRLHAELSRGLDPLLVEGGDFRFEPGILVTTAAAVSGLEFDAVVLPDLTPAFYPSGPELARALYVAATRARDWLWLLTPDKWSPLVFTE